MQEFDFPIPDDPPEATFPAPTDLGAEMAELWTAVRSVFSPPKVGPPTPVKGIYNFAGLHVGSGHAVAEEAAPAAHQPAPVYWPDDDANWDLAHLPGTTVDETPFPLDVPTLKRLLRLNGVRNAPGVRLVALRGLVLEPLPASTEPLSTVTVRESRPDPRRSRCAMVVLDDRDPSSPSLYPFPASTIPALWAIQQSVWGHYYDKNGKPQGERADANLLLTGRHVYKVGAHRPPGKVYPGCLLRYPGASTSPRTLCVRARRHVPLQERPEDLVFSTGLTPEAEVVRDNVHAAGKLTTDVWTGSAGCIVVLGSFKDGVPRDPDGVAGWKSFRRLLATLSGHAGDPAPPDDTPFDLTLLTGREARLAARPVTEVPDETLRRWRQGFWPAAGSAAQTALMALQKQLGTGADGAFGGVTAAALWSWQRQEVQAKRRAAPADGILTPADAAALIGDRWQDLVIEGS